LNKIRYLYAIKGVVNSLGLHGGVTRLKLFFSWLNLESTLDKRRGKMGVVRRRQLKR